MDEVYKAFDKLLLSDLEENIIYKMVYSDIVRKRNIFEQNRKAAQDDR